MAVREGFSEITKDATPLPPIDGDKIEIKLTYNLLEKRQIHFQWESNFLITKGVFELIDLRANNNSAVVYSGDNFEYILKYTSECLGKQSGYKIVLKEDGVIAESNKIIIDIPPEIPSLPSAPKLQLSSKTTAFVRWNAVENNGTPITAYHLDCLVPNSNDYTQVYTGTDRNIKLPLKLDSDKEYRFRLRAENSVGCSQCGPVLRYLTSPGKPTAPSPPQFESHTASSITICWDEVSSSQQGDTVYILEMESPSSGHGFLVVHHDTASHYRKEGLNRTCQYKFRLAINNQFGTSAYSQVVTYSTGAEVPDKPHSIALRSKPEHRYLHVAWDSPRDDGGAEVVRYSVEVTAFGRQNKKPYCLECEDSQVKIHDLRAGKEYRVRVAAQNGAGVGKYSASEIFRTKIAKPESPMLKGFEGIIAEINSLKLQWGYPGYDGGGKICKYQLDMLEAGDWNVVYQDRHMSYTVHNLQAITTYSFRVRCENEAGYSPFTETFEATTVGGVPLTPLPPNLLCPQALSISVSWSPPGEQGAPITSYLLQMKTISSVKWRTVYEGLKLACELKQSISADTKYQCRLAATNRFGTSAWSDVTSVRTCLGPPGQVQNVRASKIKPKSALINWSPVELDEFPVTSYSILLNHNIHTSLSASSFSHIIETLHPMATYEVQVQANNQIGRGMLSSVVSIRTPPLPPDPPTLELSLLTSNSVLAKWTPTSLPSDKYTLQIKASGQSSYCTAYSGADRKHKLLRLRPRSGYAMRISATNTSGEGKLSEEISFYTLPQVPPIVREVRTEWVRDKLLLSWTGQECELYLYQLQYRESGSEFRAIHEGKNCRCILNCQAVAFDIRVVTKLILTDKLDTNWPDFLESNPTEIIAVSRPRQEVNKSEKKAEKYFEKRFKIKEPIIEEVPAPDEDVTYMNRLRLVLNSPYLWVGILVLLTLILSIGLPFYVKFD